LHADSFEHCPHGPSRNHAGTLGRRFQQNPPSAEPPDHFVRYGAFDKRYGNHALFGFFYTFAYGFRYFSGFAEAKANRTGAITDDNNGTKAKPASTLDDLGHPIDVNHFVN
jgi:hypothetical protein